jgi:DNA-binding transcriptional LysR family regulator
VSLTAEGKTFAARARRAIDELEMASQDLRDLAAVHRGRVVVACIPPMMATIVPHVVRRIDHEYPAVEVQIRDVLSGEVEELVARGDADFGIGPRPSSTSLAFVRLERDDFVVAVPRDHPLAGKNAIDLEELAAYPVVTTTRDANARQILDRAIQRLRRPIKPRFELVQHFSVGRLVEADLGVTALPRTAVPSLASDRIVTVDIKSPRIFREIGLISRRNYHPSPSAEVFITLLKAFIGKGQPIRSRPGRLAKVVAAPR